jgi:hypothetical protein
MRCCIAVSSFLTHTMTQQHSQLRLFFLLLLVFFCSSSPREHHSKSLNSASCEKQGIEQEAKNTAVVKQPSVKKKGREKPKEQRSWDGREVSRG